MIKVNKIISLLISVFLILSNVSLAQYYDSSGPVPGYYEGRPIDTSKEGKDYYREGEVIVYPAKMGSEEEQMMQRFSRGALNEEEMRSMAKAKFGDKFDEMEFKKGMIELKERVNRKEAFSYDHQGYEQTYYVGPSYKGYSKEHMIFGMVFQHIGDDVDPRDIKQYCSDPNKVADIVIKKLKDKVGDLQKLCTKMEEQEAKCAETTKKSCSQLGSAMVREDASEIEKINSLAYSCPVNEDAIVESCKKRSLHHIEQRIKNSDESCKERFDFEGERLLKECERFRESNNCDKEKFMKQCMGGFKKEDFEEKKEGTFTYAKWECYDGTAESHTDGSCKSSEKWSELAEKSCDNRCNADNSKCGVNVFSVSGECKPISTCPTQTVPPCKEGESLQKKLDDKGCVYYYCESFSCPQANIPVCQAGVNIKKSVDERGCVFYYCETKLPCPTVEKPACNPDQTLQTYYDNAGCVTSYQCLRHETSCPEVSRPVCAEGQSLTTRYDDRGCITGYECVIVTTTSTNPPAITGQAVLNTYDDFVRQCENSWHQQQRMCANIQSVCDKETFVEKCKEQEKKNYDDLLSRVEKNCETQTKSEIKHAEQRCSKLSQERERCFKENEKRCEHMEGNAQQCRETLTEENLRKFILEEIKKRCKFTNIIQDEDDVRKAGKAEIVLAVLNTATQDDIDKLELFVDNLKEELKLQDTTVYKGTINPNNFGDVKLLPFVVNAKISAVASSERAKEVKAKIVAGQKAEEAASKLVSLRDSDVPKEYLYIIEDKASEVLDVSEELEDVEKKEEQKGLGYKIRLFLGLAKAAEKEEIKQLEESKSKLTNSIETLAKLVDEVPSDVAKAILKEQIENLKKQQEDIEVLIETKEKKSKGLLGLFG